MIDFLKKHRSNIVFIAFAIFLFSPYGMPVRTALIQGVSMVTTRVFNLQIDAGDRAELSRSNWRLRDLKGGEIEFDDLEGQVVLVNFWATWCPPCRAEMPSMQKLYDSYGDRMVFLFVARDEAQRVDEFLKKNGYDLPVYYESGLPPMEMRSNSLPTTYILDVNGKIAVEKVGAADWNSGKVREMLDDLIQQKKVAISDF